MRDAPLQWALWAKRGSFQKGKRGRGRLPSAPYRSLYAPFKTPECCRSDSCRHKGGSQLHGRTSGRPRLLRGGAVGAGAACTGRLGGRLVLLVVCRVVHAGDCSARGIGPVLEGRVPLQGDRRGAGDGVLPSDGVGGGGVLAVVPREEVAVEVGLLGAG